MSKPVVSDPIYAVRAEAVPVVIYAHQLGPANFRIRLARGIGWAPKRYASAAEVLAALMPMAQYTIAEAKMAKAICTEHP